MKFLVLILFSSLAGFLSSQDYFLLNKSLVTPEAHIAYRNQSNHLVIPGLKINSNTYLASSTDTLFHNGKAFFYRPKTQNEFDTLQLFVENEYTTSVVFNVRSLTHRPNIFFGTVRDTFVSKAQLLENPGLICSYEPDLFISEIRIIHFEAAIIKKNGKEVDIKGRSSLPRRHYKWSEEKLQRYYKKHHLIDYRANQFSYKQLKQIKKMKTGEILWLKTATVLSADSRANIITLDLKLTLVEND